MCVCVDEVYRVPTSSTDSKRVWGVELLLYNCSSLSEGSRVGAVGTVFVAQSVLDAIRESVVFDSLVCL